MSTTIDDSILERIAFLREQIKHANSQSTNESLMRQVAILQTADLRNLDRSIEMRKTHLRKTADPAETERLFCELEALEWLQREVTSHQR